MFSISIGGALPLDRSRGNFTRDLSSDGHVDRRGLYGTTADASHSRADLAASAAAAAAMARRRRPA